MPDSDIERVIYKLELDGSAYIEGADKLAASTTKLSDAQEAANKKLIELKAQQSSYKRELDSVNAILKANESETIELTKRLNDLKAAEKGTSVEAKNLQAQLRAIATNTKEFRIEQAALKTNLLSSNTAIKAHTVELKAAEAANGKFTSGLTKAYSGLRTIANLIPGIGIGGLAALIAGPLVNAVTSWYEGLQKANFQLQLLKANQQNVNDVMEAADKSAGKQIIDARVLYETATNVNNSMKDRLAAVKALQQEFPDYFGNIKTETILNGEAKKSYDELKESILATARATAAKAKLDELESKALDAENQKNKIRIATTNEALAAKTFTTGGAGTGGSTVTGFGTASTQVTVTREEQIKRIRERREAAIAEQDAIIKQLRAQEDFLIKFAGLTNIATTIEDADAKKFKEKKQKQTKVIENIYEQELQKLKADIAKLDEKGFTDEATITKAIEEDFKKRSDAFDKAFKNKQLTARQLASLQGYLKNLEDLTLNAQLKSFREQRQAYLQAINDEITNLQIEESTKRISTIQDSFERERQTIINETDKTVAALEQKRDKRISDIIKNAARNGLTPQEIAPQIQQIKDTYSKLLDDLQVIKNQKLQQLAFETFEALSEEAKRALDAENLGISQGSLTRIQREAELLAKGKISYEQYQKDLTQIAKNEANERFKVEKLYLEQEIKIRQDKLALDKNLTDDQIKKLKDEIRKLQQQLADAEKGNITGNAADPDKDRLKQLAAYADAIGKVADSVIGFWQAANAAETKALDYSISLQEKRVDAAQKIADRGNAEYLKSEKDRLTQLNVARENAARKQLGIDAALQASQILVGITGAISKIASSPFGAETIAEIAVIIGALATGYGIVKSLQGNQPKLYKGTKYLERDGNPSGRDTIPVMANEGEAVIPTDTNKEYHPAISAIYDRTIPAEDLNAFVNTYHKLKPIPQPNYERIKEAAELKIGHDGRMSVLLMEHGKKMDEHIELQKLTLSAMKKLGVKVNVDKHGLAISQMEVIEEIKKSKRK